MIRRHARRNSTDSDLRSLEREAGGGDPSALARFAVARQRAGQDVAPWELFPQSYVLIQAWRMGTPSWNTRRRKGHEVGRVEAIVTEDRTPPLGPVLHGSRFYVVPCPYPFHMEGSTGRVNDYIRMGSAAVGHDLRRGGHAGPGLVARIDAEVHLIEAAKARAAGMIVITAPPAAPTALDLMGEVLGGPAYVATREAQRTVVLGRAEAFTQHRDWHVQHLLPADYASVRIMTKRGKGWKNNPPERDLRLAREELDDAIFFNKPAGAIAQLQAHVAQLEGRAAAPPQPEGPIQRRERLEQEAFRHAQAIEQLNAQAAALARQIETLEYDYRQSVSMRDPAHEIERTRAEIAARRAEHTAVSLDLDMAQRNLAAMSERAQAELGTELGPHGPRPMAPRAMAIEADRQRATAELRQTQIRIASLRSELDDPSTQRDFQHLQVVRRELREAEEEAATLTARVKQNPRRPRRNPGDDDTLRRLEREAAQSPHDQALQERLEHERTRLDPEGSLTLETARSLMLQDLERFSLTLHMPGPNWRLLERLNGVMADFAGLSVDSVQRRFSDTRLDFEVHLWSTNHLMSEVGLHGVARAIQNASRPQIRRYMAARDAALAYEIQADERVRAAPAQRRGRRRPRSNPELPAPRDSLLPAVPAQVLPRNVWSPPRVSWDLMTSGRQPLVYLPEGVPEKPGVRTALEQVMTREGLASVDAWERLLVEVGNRGKLFVVDRNGERWQVLDVVAYYGGDSGYLRVRHIGRLGDRSVDIHEVYGRAIPVVVYKPYDESGLPMNAGSVAKRQAVDIRQQIHSLQQKKRHLTFGQGPFAEAAIEDQIEDLEDQLQRLEGGAR